MQAKQTKLPHFNSVQLLFCQKLKRKLWIKLPWFCMNNLSFIFNLNQWLLNLQGVKGGGVMTQFPGLCCCKFLWQGLPPASCQGSCRDLWKLYRSPTQTANSKTLWPISNFTFRTHKWVIFASLFAITYCW